MCTVVVRRGTVGADDARGQSVPGRRQLGHRHVPEERPTSLAAALLPRRTVRLTSSLFARSAGALFATVTRCP